MLATVVAADPKSRAKLDHSSKRSMMLTAGQYESLTQCANLKF